MQVLQNKGASRFETSIDGVTAFIEYVEKPGAVLLLTHTCVPRQISGRGVGTELVVETLKLIRQLEYKIVPLCPFIVAYLKKTDEFQDIIAPKLH
ncbi:GNAT family N-acetyltransferase [Flavobacterium aurantiibacter]|uniref:N-acetyltransferase domain-containing protein n=1 Tax=Flavobacterium aurantiibacter TaxID=2023067 RepID=A0A255ZQW3_9FLAO|nr:GNAT family N-acetyltransferase [Flavobacterium aurantiibacter]OYQ43782.1 hypothetical protein CHX27_08860 [Flavobacterium aurantiibacter]